MELSAAGLFRVKWTEQIQEEWISRLIENRPDLDRTRLERTRALMAAAVPDCLVQEYESLIPSFCPTPTTVTFSPPRSIATLT